MLQSVACMVDLRLASAYMLPFHACRTGAHIENRWNELSVQVHTCVHVHACVPTSAASHGQGPPGAALPGPCMGGLFNPSCLAAPSHCALAPTIDPAQAGPPPALPSMQSLLWQLFIPPQHFHALMDIPISHGRASFLWGPCFGLLAPYPSPAPPSPVIQDDGVVVVVNRGEKKGFYKGGRRVL